MPSPLSTPEHASWLPPTDGRVLLPAGTSIRMQACWGHNRQGGCWDGVRRCRRRHICSFCMDPGHIAMSCSVHYRHPPNVVRSTTLGRSPSPSVFLKPGKRGGEAHTSPHSSRREVTSPPPFVLVDTSDPAPMSPKTPSGPYCPSVPSYTPPARPNTELLFPLTSPHDLPMPPIKLHAEAWSAALEHYPDRNFASELVSAIRYGVLLGVTDTHLLPPPSTHPRPLPSALAFPETVMADIAHEVSLGRIIDITDEVRSPPTHLSPVGSVPKKYSSKRRRIHHLSFPPGSSVNHGIPREHAYLQYEAVLAAIDRIRSAGQGCFLYKADLEAAFRHIAIHPSHIHFLGFEWNGRIYLDIFLPFGLRTAPRLYNFFAEAHHWILLRRDEALRLIQHYLDDWLNVTSAARGLAYAQHGRAVFRAVTEELGFSLAEGKEQGPCHVLEFLGIEFDTIAMEARLPHDKLHRLLSLLADCLSRGTASHYELEQLSGHLIFAQSVIPVGRFFTRRIRDFMHTLISAPRRMRRRLPAEAKKDVAWWHSFLPSFNGIYTIGPSLPQLHIFTDASGKLGLGGHWGDAFFAEMAPSRQRHLPIHWREMWAVLRAAQIWGHRWRGHEVVFHIDNEAIVTCLRSGSIDHPPTQALFRKFALLAVAGGFTFQPVWISSRDNHIADALSRFQWLTLSRLFPHWPLPFCSGTRPARVSVQPSDTPIL